MDQIWQSYLELPIITRTYFSACAVTTLCCQLHFVNPYQLYFNLDEIRRGQIWRLVTNFLYFGPFGIDFLFHMFFLVRYCRNLEEGSFRGRSADFFFMLLFGAVLLTLMEPFLNIFFLGFALTFMIVYVWGRRNKHVRMQFLFLTFTAPYLPWVLLGFSFVVAHSAALTDVMGIAVGHLYYYLEDFYPEISGRRLLKTPRFLKVLFGEAEPIDHIAVVPPTAAQAPLVRPGGFDWGGALVEDMPQEEPIPPASDSGPSSNVFTALRQRHRNVEDSAESSQNTNEEAALPDQSDGSEESKGKEPARDGEKED